jgi:hypothetical protein
MLHTKMLKLHYIVLQNHIMFFLVRICQMLQKETIILQIQIKQREMATILKLAIKNIYPNYQHYTDIDTSVNTGPHISCL